MQPKVKRRSVAVITDKLTMGGKQSLQLARVDLLEAILLADQWHPPGSYAAESPVPTGRLVLSPGSEDKLAGRYLTPFLVGLAAACSRLPGVRGRRPGARAASPLRSRPELGSSTG